MTDFVSSSAAAVDKVYRFTLDYALYEFSAIKNGEKKVGELLSYIKNESIGMIGHPSQWRITIIPLVKSRIPAKNYMSIYLHLESPVEIEVDATVCARVYKEKMATAPALKPLSFNYSFWVKGDENNKGDGWLNFLDHDDITPQHLVDDCLRLKVNVRFTVVSGGESSMEAMKNTDAPGILVDSLSRLLLSGTLVDFVLVSSDGLRFPVHKVILAAQSQVFTNMFEHNFQELKSNECKITDTDGETIKAMVSFCYGRKNWQPHLSEKLLTAANKYKIAKLEETCIGMLLENLTMTNAASVLLLADMHSLDEMKDKIIDFMICDIMGFIRVGGFKKLTPDLVNEVLDEAHSKEVGDQSGEAKM